MTRSRARMLFRLALLTAAPLLAAVSGDSLRSAPPAGSPALLAGLRPVSQPPRLLELPRDVVPVALDFVPPLPQVDQRQRDDRSVAPAIGPGSYILSATRQPELGPPRLQRLPPVDEIQPASPEPQRGSGFPLSEPPVRPAETRPAPEMSSPPLETSRQFPRTVQTQHVPRQPAALAAVTERAEGLVQYGMSLAERGAFYSARANFIQALRTLTQALDAQAGTTTHSQALADGLKALSEAEDFSPKGAQLEADLDLPGVIAGHRTPVLKGADSAEITPLMALQRYYTYAQQRLVLACGEQPAGSQALYGLGKLTIVMAQRSAEERRLHGPKAIVLHNAALAVDRKNHLAANELGVLLAGFGQWHEARQALLHCVSLAPSAEAWHNLAVVHERLGERDLANRARYEVQLAQRQATTPARQPGGPRVAWVDAAEFARTHGESTAPAEPRSASSGFHPRRK